MPIKFEHGGSQYEADSPEQAAWLIDWLDKREAARANMAVVSAKVTDLIASRPKIDSPPSPWTPEVFSEFLGRLGDKQATVLGLLVSSGSMSDDSLRTVADVQSNQALSGVLSGISKQATRLGISPRDVFWIENKREERTRSRRSTYHIAGNFRLIADELKWPEKRLVW